MAMISHREMRQFMVPIFFSTATEEQDSRYYCIGHGLGMSGEYPNIPHKKPHEKYPISGELEPGMVICIESYIGSKEQVEGIKFEDQFLITETGSENMSLGAEFDYRLES
jgi:Xaa-Pro dipeptidase